MRSITLVAALLVVLLLAAPAVAADKPTKGLRYPSLTPDGKQVVFSYRGDLWVAPVGEKGPARRLTLHEAQETLPRVSPDGKHVVFASARNGGHDLFVMPITGGVPKQLTFHSVWDLPCDWSPDGKRILFMSARSAAGIDLYEVGIDGGTPRRITFDGGREGTYSDDGKQIAYVRGFNSIYWDNYEGSANYDIYVVDTKGGTPRRLTKTKGNERYPSFSKDGRQIWFVAEEKGVANYYTMPVAGGERTQVTKYTGNDVHRPCVNRDRKTAVFERVGQLYTDDLTKPAAKPSPVGISIKSDVRHSGIEKRTVTSGGEQVHLSPGGGDVAFTLGGDIWVMPASGGTGRRLTSGPANDQWPRFSPDGKTIAYFSNAKGNSDIFLLDLASRESKPVTTHAANDFFQNWSPDGKHLVFTSERSGNREIWIVELSTGIKTQLTNDRTADDDSCFSPDGTMIAFDSAREGSQAIYVMNTDGSNVRRVTTGSGFFQVPTFSPDGRMICYEAYNPMNGRSGGLFVVRTGGGASVQISRDGAGACWSPSGDYIYFHAVRGRSGSGIYRVRAPQSVDAGERVPFIGQVEVDIRKELADLFDEAWNALKDGFYDSKMHGVNWTEMRKKYRDMAIDAEVKSEFQTIIRQMLAELGASHLGISGGTTAGNGVTPNVEPTGYLGLEFEQGPATDGGRKVAEVLPGGPADAAGIRVGDVVTAVGRSRLAGKTNLDKTLRGTVGKDLPVRFKPLSEAGLGSERSGTMKPISSNAVRALRYRKWESTCQKRVKDGTKGRIGYVHLTMMNGSNLQKFQQMVARFNSSRKIKGMILDVRNNGGGNIHNQLMSVFFAKPLARMQSRGRPKSVQPTLYWNKPVVLLVNERSFSDAEVFPHMFKAAGIGQVVGVPTAGGVIGTRDITLSDGSRFRVPGVGFWTMEGKNLEGLGVEPDVLVEETSEDRLNGRDPQLAKAIELDLAEVKGAATPAKATPKPVKPEPKTEPRPVKPMPKPEPSPAATAKPAVGPMRPLDDAKAGEWIRYTIRDPQSGEEAVLKVRVANVSNGLVHFEKTVEQGGSDFLLLPEKVPQGSVLEFLPVFGKILSHAIQGKLLTVAIQTPDGPVINLTFTNEIPAYGLKKIEMAKTVILEATEWGVETAPAPAEEPEEGTAEKTEAPDHPVYDAQIGEWVKVRRSDPSGREVEMTLTVLEVTDTEVVLGRTISVGGRELKGPNLRRKRDEKLVPPDGFALSSYGKETVTVGGKDLACLVMAAEDPNGIAWRWLVSPEIPVNGYVRVERDGEVVSELLEWGTGEGE